MEPHRRSQSPRRPPYTMSLPRIPSWSLPGSQPGTASGRTLGIAPGRRDGRIPPARCGPLVPMQTREAPHHPSLSQQCEAPVFRRGNHLGGRHDVGPSGYLNRCLLAAHIPSWRRQFAYFTGRCSLAFSRVRGVGSRTRCISGGGDVSEYTHSARTRRSPE